MSWIPIVISFAGELYKLGQLVRRVVQDAKAGRQLALKIALDELAVEAERLARKKANDV